MIVGIDPQPRLLAFHVRNSLNITLAWFKHYLQKKSRFNNAQEWQEYLYDQCIMVLKEKIPQVCHTQQLPSLVVCEQQKGRVNSIIEQSILAACRSLGIKLLILHPTSWKKATGVPCLKDYRKNKQVVEQMVGPKLQQWFKDNNINKDKEDEDKNRLHDLCDAEKISEAGLLITSKEQSSNRKCQNKSQ